MKIIEFHLIIHKINKNLIMPHENHENHENHIIQLENNENHETPEIPYDDQ